MEIKRKTSYTKVVYQFHGDKEPITFTLRTSIINQWIEEKKPIKNLRRLGWVKDFREFTKEV